MKNNFFLFVVIALSFASCEEKGPQFALLPPGQYEGTYKRWSLSTPNPEVARVHISLKDGAFSGGSNMARYPAICNGKYWVTGTQVEFTNLCAWTADFDWSFILNGKFDITSDGDTFQLMQKNGSWIDIYELKRNSINN